MSAHKNHAGYWRADHTPAPILPATAVEPRLRATYRRLVRDLLKYTTRGARGASLTAPHILRDIRAARARHTASIAREKPL